MDCRPKCENIQNNKSGKRKHVIFNGLRIGKDFLNRRHKTLIIKSINDKLDFIKLRNSLYQKTTKK